MLLLLLGCFDTNYNSGTFEPITVRDATFFEGAIPEDPDALSPAIVYAAGVNNVITQGKGNVSYSGLATTDAYSVAVAFPTVGTGYWVVPVEGVDVTQDDDYIFHTVLDFTPEVPYGIQTLSFVAFDEEGYVGPRYDTQVCILAESSDGNLSACSDEVTPQNAVISLSWDTNVDLDLVVVTPEGKVVNSKSPTTIVADGKIESEQIEDPSTGTLSRDSNKNCAIDSIRVESLVFPGEPPPGDYLVYASLFAPCGESYVNYGLTRFQRVDAADGTHPVERTELAAGQLLGSQADAGESNGTFVTTVTLP